MQAKFLTRTWGAVHPTVTVLFLSALYVGVGPARATGGTLRIASATSYLESAVCDLLGGEARVLRLAEPGTCPGHFDIRPSQAAELRRCDVLIRFDFQSSLDAVLEGGSDQPKILAITVHGGLCCTDSYLNACRQVAEGLVAEHWLSPSEAKTRLAEIEVRLTSLAQSATNQIAQVGLRGRPVLASSHQKDFCEWLGLKVVGTFRASDTIGVREIDDAVKGGESAGTRLIIGNVPEGRRAADALGERLSAKVIMFDNFPTLRNGKVAFDDMVRENVKALVKVARP